MHMESIRRAPVAVFMAACALAAGCGRVTEGSHAAPQTPQTFQAAPPAAAPDPGAVRSGDAFAFWPGASYDASSPTLREVIGHDPGERITRPEDALIYLKALEAAHPDRMRVFEYARSWENRPLVYAVVGSAETIAQIDTIRAGMVALADPRVTSENDARALIETLPASVFIAYGVHGNEISSTDAALFAAYHLLSARNDPTVTKILQNTVFLIDPMQNPDGRARFVHNFETTLGLEPSGSRIAAERREPWPGGRTNHYLFDMNRDWFALTQPETRGRIRILREWMPIVFVDAHEMGSNSTYYFAPEAAPYNPHLAPAQRDNLMLFGRNNAKWFDANGFNYFTREVYDAFFPGYGASWPAYYGALSMTYEQASARGLLAQRDNGETFHYRDTVHRQFVASISTLETAADNRRRLLSDFWDYRKSAIEEGRKETVRSYIIPATDDRASANRLAANLVQQGIEVKTATAPFTACGRSYPAGAHVVPLAQPAKRLVRTLIDPNVPLPEDFIREQERLREKDLPDEIYDVTAWSLPMMANIRTDACDTAVGAGAIFVDHDGASVRAGSVLGPEGSLAYVAAWGERPAAVLAARALKEDLVIRSADRAFTIAGRTLPAGSLIFLAADNPADLRARLETLAAQTGANIIGLASTWVDDGPNFGSNRVARLRAPRIAVAWDAPTSANQAGAMRFVLERQLGLAATPVRVSDLKDAALGQFDVLILPGETGAYGMTYRTLLGKSGAERLKAWVESGGVLIATTGATRWLADPETGLLSIRREDAFREEPASARADDKARVGGTLLKTPEDARKAIVPLQQAPDPSAGVLAVAAVDADHWLAAGAPARVHTILSGGDIYTPIALDRGVNVARFLGAGELLASGYLWAETRAQYAYKPLIVAERHGAGHVIGFTQDPAFRAQLDGMNIFLANAVIHGPARSGKLH